MAGDFSPGPADDERELRSIPFDPMWTPITREDVLFILMHLGDGTDPRIARLYDALLHRWLKAPAAPPERGTHIFAKQLTDEQRTRLAETLERGAGTFARIHSPDARERHAIDRFKDSRGIPRPGK